MKSLIDRYVNSLARIREELLEMDDIARPVMGIKSWDDSACIKFGNKKLVISVDGPYTKRLVLKSALIHATTDVVVKGARPLLALDTVIGNKKDVDEMVRSLKRQALKMEVPILGGNTLFDDVEPRCSLTIIGELIIKKPIADSTAKKDDVILIVGEPIWGEQEERIPKAKKLFETWYEILKNTAINSSKDVTKGGLISVIYEMEKKSGRKFSIKKDIPFPMTRNLDNFFVTVNEKSCKKIVKICEKNKCQLEEIGRVL